MSARKIVDSGLCGHTVNWALDDKGLVIISGSGEINSHPWTESNASRVVIEEGVTSIEEEGI